MTIPLDDDSFVLAFGKCVSKHVEASLCTLRAPDSVIASTKKTDLDASQSLHIIWCCKVLKCRQVGTEMLWLCGTHFRKMGYEIGMHAVEEVPKIGMCCMVKICMIPASTKRHIEPVAND